MFAMLIVIVAGSTPVPEWVLDRRPLDAPAGATAWMNVLRFPSLDASLDLTPARQSESVFWAGWFDIQHDAVNVSWLREWEVLWVSWKIVPQGQGSYTTQCHAIVATEPSLDVLWQEAFLVYSHSGPDHDTKAVTIEYLPNTATYRVQIVEERVRRSSKPQPLAKRLGDESWLQETQLIQWLNLRFREGCLAVDSRQLWLDLGYRTIPAKEIAEFAVLLLAPRWRQGSGLGTATAEEVEQMLEDLRRSGDETLTGRIPLPYGATAVAPLAPGDDFYPWHSCSIQREP
jgi:hypothetical protein